MLMDDSITPIINSVLAMRNVIYSLQKLLLFQIPIIFVVIVCMFIGAAAAKTIFLSPIQILWVSLIIDTFAAYALATEQPNHHILFRNPFNNNSSISHKKCFNILLDNLYTKL